MRKFLIGAIAVLTIFAMVSCGGGGSKKSGNADLTALSVGGVAATSMPTPITSEEWDAQGSLPGAAEKTVEILVPTAAIANGITDVAASNKASVSFVLGGTSATTRPSNEFGAKEDIVFPPAGAHLFVRVVSENGKTTNYFRFNITTPSSSTNPGAITIGGVTVTSRGSPNEDWAEAEAGSVALNSTNRTNAVVTAAANPSAPGQTFRFAYVAAPGTAAPTFSATWTAQTLDDGDVVYVEVTAPNEINKIVYKIVIEVGRNANLASVTAGTITIMGDFLGDPGTAWNNVVDNGSLEITCSLVEPLAFAVVPEDVDATVSWAIRNEATTPTTEPTWDNPATKQYNGEEEDEFLYVKVVSGNGLIVKVYKFTITFPAVGEIVYGVIDLDDPDGEEGEWYIDPRWLDTDVKTFNINRVNRAEGEYTANPWFRESWGQHTSGSSKALWNDEGIWIWTTVYKYPWKTDVDDAENPAAVDTGGNEHTNDSVEMYVNERLQYLNEIWYDVEPKPPANSANRHWGIQYRTDANNARSGDAGNETPPNVIANWADNGISRVKRMTGNSVGYEVMAFLPWEFGPFGNANETNKGRATDIWNADGTIKADTATIGFELQINACSNGGRDGILTWNGINNQSYQNATGYGQVKLVMGNGTRQTRPERPKITTMPVGEDYEEGDTATPLTIVANVTEGALTYEWFKADSAIAVGTAVGTGVSYTPDTSVAGTFYYYVNITNTDATKDITTLTIKSDVVRVRVFPAGVAAVTIDFTTENPGIYNVAEFNAAYNAIGVGAFASAWDSDGLMTMTIGSSGLEVTARSSNSDGISIILSALPTIPGDWQITVKGTKTQSGTLGFCWGAADVSTSNPANGSCNVPGTFSSNNEFEFVLTLAGDYTDDIRIMTQSWVGEATVKMDYTIESIEFVPILP